ncbi:hypothetical protein K461DRAFT_321826 [Myriangium duriaei CBS 260.36]|uniref:Ribosomal RNA methyltransferase FtsJ domain-containing protein n=1 Tax=Myriangium duriaei CBS 260.36 TaxID=1168546 RepID=A0A9P4J018_9PEZI|nr:hypothetical protein K461DRAFT_321826 [Myriangium duriaei CBS 260.36]
METITDNVKEEQEEAFTQLDKAEAHADRAIKAYLRERVPEFQRLAILRERGWKNKSADTFFQKQRDNADHCNKKTARFFYSMMKEIAQQLHDSTGCLCISNADATDRGILDFCMAPGGFLATALDLNSGAHALAFSLPLSVGGHRVLLPRSPAFTLRFLDITMLAADMGVTQIPSGHPDAQNFLPQALETGKMFDLILCDGQVLREHIRASYRERREVSRLILTQLALGLQHVRPGGSMVVLLHKVETWKTLRLLFSFSKFSSVRLFKSNKYHTKRSSFYMIATDIQPLHDEALLTIEAWKAAWTLATFGTDEALESAGRKEQLKLGPILDAFGSELSSLGREIWKIQADALEQAPWFRNGGGEPTE